MSARAFPKDTEIVCPNGHPICKARQDIVPAQHLHQDYFEWYVEKPPSGALMNCPICGENYGGGHVFGGSRFHTKDGWFYSRGAEAA